MAVAEGKLGDRCIAEAPWSLPGQGWPCHQGPERRGRLHPRFGLVQADTGVGLDRAPISRFPIAAAGACPVTRGPAPLRCPASRDRERRYRAHLSDPRGQDRVRGSAQKSCLLWLDAAAGPILAIGSTAPARSPRTLGGVGGPQCADIACALVTSLVASGGNREPAAQFADRGEFFAHHPFGQAV